MKKSPEAMIPHPWLCTQVFEVDVVEVVEVGVQVLFLVVFLQIGQLFALTDCAFV